MSVVSERSLMAPETRRLAEEHWFLTHIRAMFNYYFFFPNLMLVKFYVKGYFREIF